MSTYVSDFADGSEAGAERLGAKGAGLAEMVALGLPVPPGFTISTEACRHHLQHGAPPPGLSVEVDDHLADLEKTMGRRFGDPDDPLLVAVRSGASVSMPGMMDTVLDVGLNDRAVHGLAARTGDARFALDSYRRLLQMFGETVLHVPAGAYGDVLAARAETHGVTDPGDLGVPALRDVVTRFHDLTETHAGRTFPQDPREQLELAVRSVFDSWHSERAVAYRRHHGIPDDLGTAVTVQAMVFGNRGARSGSGVCFTRDPATGSAGLYGDYLVNAQGEDVVSGARTPVPVAELGAIDPASYSQLVSLVATLERHYRDMCDIEFTVEEGRLWMLQTRIGKRTAAAAFRIAADQLADGTIDADEALRRVTGDQLAQLMFPQFDTGAAKDPLTRGVGASPGAAVGRVVFDNSSATSWASRGEEVILVRQETRAEDVPGMLAAAGVLTSRGGKTSHAAVVARGMGRPCVVGASALEVQADAKRVTIADGQTLAEGDVVSIDGTTGEVFRGEAPLVPSPVARWFDEDAIDAADAPLVGAVAVLMAHADAVRTLGVFANADNGSDAARALRFGAEGIGLARTEHMFLGERQALVERLILADDDTERVAALDALLPLQRGDFSDLFAAMDGRPVTIRLIDPPLHEFLPDLTEIAVRVAVAEERHESDTRDHRLLAAVTRLHEQNPMLGLRGVRLAIAVPGLVAMQARAILEAAADQVAAGGAVRPEIMVPLVGSVRELELVRQEITRVAREVARERGVDVPFRVGAMIELPRAALTADQIAAACDFMSFGTNDLTQLTWGLSRDDVEATVVRRYLELGLLHASPFETLDVEGVGQLVGTATDRARTAHPEVHIGVCGEHGGDPTSIGFFDRVGLDYVSCSPFRVPVARLEAGRAAVREEH